MTPETLRRLFWRKTRRAWVEVTPVDAAYALGIPAEFARDLLDEAVSTGYARVDSVCNTGINTRIYGIDAMGLAVCGDMVNHARVG